MLENQNKSETSAPADSKKNYNGRRKYYYRKKYYKNNKEGYQKNVEQKLEFKKVSITLWQILNALG